MSAIPHLDDTIAALASAPGPAERGIIRISGPDTRKLVPLVFTPNNQTEWNTARVPRRHRGAASVPGLSLPLPIDVLLWPTNRSYTGQPLAELHTMGSPPVLEGLLQQLFAHGARPAQRGEFSLRAFLSGRIDLVQAEAVLGVIDASDQQQLRLALDQLGGGLSRRIAALHEELLLHLSDLEAGLDFVEEDIEFVSREALTARIADHSTFLRELRDQAASRLQSTGRSKVVLAGLPNAGKSTLLNALTGGEAALVSVVPGTTRDYLCVPVEWHGLAIELIDTAGWDDFEAGDSDRAIERAADESRREQWRRADLLLWCSPVDFGSDAAALNARLRDETIHSGAPVLHVTTKADLAGELPQSADARVSAITGSGVDEIRRLVTARLQASGEGESMLGSTAARCRDSLRGAVDALDRAHSAALGGAGDELISVELRTALDSLGQVTGQTYTDDILDRIFSRFCIGK